MRGFYNVAPQAEGESDMDFQKRVGGALRDQGHIIEAHEASTGKYYDQDANTMTGIVGAAALALQGVDYHVSGERQVDTDFAAGVVVQAPKDDRGTLALLAVLLGMR